MRRFSLFLFILTAMVAAKADTYTIVGDFTGTPWNLGKGVQFSPISGSIELETTFSPISGQRFVVVKNNDWNQKYITESGSINTSTDGYNHQLKSIGNADQYIVPAASMARQYIYLNPLSMQLTVAPAPLSRKDYVYRIVAPEGWTDFSGIQFNAWNKVEKRLSNDNNRPTVKISSVKANVNGEPRTVLEFHMYSTWTPSTVQFIHSDGRSFNVEIDNVRSDVIYTQDGRNIVEEYVIDPSVNPVVYFNSGGWIVRNVNVKLYKEGTNVSESGAMGLANAGEPNIWKYSSFKNKSDYDAVEVTLDRFENGGWTTLTLSSVAGDDYDRSRYSDFIYGTGTGMIVQSYLTYDDYRKLKDGVKKEVFIAGSANIGLDWDPAVSAGARRIESEDGVFYFDFVALDLNNYPENERDRLFKISWIDVDEAYDSKYTSGFRGEARLRGWASYNLGIVGSTGEFEDHAGNGRSYFDFDKTMRYNNTSGADWAVGGEEKGYLTAGQTYWIVLDSHPSCKSITLLSFDPNPNVEVAELRHEVKEIGYENGRNLRLATEGAYKFAGNAANGYVFNDKVNVVSGKLRLNAAQIETIHDAGYHVEYDIYNSMDGGSRNKIMTYKGVPTEMSIDYMALGENVSLDLQALYTSTSGLWFHSRYGHGEFNYGDLRFATPQSEETGSKSLIFSTMSEDMTKGLYTPKMTLSYLVDTDLAYYMDYKVTYPVDGAAHVMTINDEKNWFSHDGSDSESYTDGHNWSRKVIDAQSFTLEASRAVELEDESNVDVVVPVDVMAVYPFLVRKQTQIVTNGTVQSAPRRAGETETFSPDEFSLLSGVLTKKVPVRFDGSVTEIATVGAESADAEPEYFNIQGVKITAPQAGQIYIVRRGDKVTKEIMRY